MRQKIFDIIDSNNDLLSKIYDRIMLCCIILSIVPLCFKNQYPAFSVIDKITVTVFIIDYLLRFITADFYYKKHNALSFLRYPFGFFAIMDIFSILPSITLLNSSFKLLRLFRLNKAFKALKLLRYSKSVRLIVNVIKKEKHALLTVCVLAFGYIFLSALIIFQVEPESFNSFFDAIYWAVITLTTVGYGDLYPVSDLGRIFGMISSFMGIAIVALPTGIITAGYMSELHNNNG